MRWKTVGENEGDFRRKLDTGVQELTRRGGGIQQSTDRLCCRCFFEYDKYNKTRAKAVHVVVM